MPPATEKEDFDLGPLVRTAETGLEFSAARELRDWVDRLVEEIAATKEWTLAPGDFDEVFVGTFARGTKTFRAALLLCDRGYGEQAAMLNRSLFEHTVVAWWMFVHEDAAELAARLKRHHDHAGVLHDRSVDRFPDMGLDRVDKAATFSDDYIAALDKEFTRYGGPWYGKKGLHELVREVEDRWQEPYPGVLWKYYHFVNHWNNYLLHHSSVGIGESIEWHSPNEGPRVTLGPTPEWTAASLWAARWSYGMLVLVTLRRLSPSRAGEFRDFFEDSDRRYTRLTRQQVRGVGRNDVCPCGSGRKFKRCHEQYVAG